MNYIWEAALAADQSGIPREKIKYRPARNGSPYAEIVLENLNSSTLESTEVEVNLLYRFAEEFSAVFDGNVEGHEKIRELLFDITMHYMVQADLRQGLSRQEYALRFLLKDLLDGVCGQKAAKAVVHFEKSKLRKLLGFIWKLYRIPLLDFEVRQPVTLSMPMAMDFGTSNTTQACIWTTSILKRWGFMTANVG